MIRQNFLPLPPVRGNARRRRRIRLIMKSIFASARSRIKFHEKVSADTQYSFFFSFVPPFFRLFIPLDESLQLSFGICVTLEFASRPRWPSSINLKQPTLNLVQLFVALLALELVLFSSVWVRVKLMNLWRKYSKGTLCISDVPKLLLFV